MYVPFACLHGCIGTCCVHGGTAGQGDVLVSQLLHELAAAGAPVELMHVRAVVRTPALPQVAWHAVGAET